MENDPAQRWRSSPPPAPGRIIMVDDEAELVRSFSGMLRNEFGPERVRDTVDAHEALGWIERERPAVLITDVRMPGLSGLELIERAREAWGTVPTVVMTAFSSHEVTSGANNGRFVYLPKPFPFRDLLEAVRELDAGPPSSFSGAVAVSTLADLLQLYATSGGTGLLAVRAGGLRGEVWFDAGRIVHAQAGDRTGFEAFCDLVRWPHGSFAWRPRAPTERTIEMHTSELLLEAYRLWDEARREGDRRAPRESTRNGTRENATMNNIQECLSRLQGVDGFIGACLVDSESGMTLGLVGGGGALNLEVAAASNTEVVRAKRKAMKSLNLKDEIEDILITLGKQYHLIRPLRTRSGVFFYMALDRTRANLAMARFSLADVEKELTF
jgi:CheY-like chemotaxis protein